MGLRQNKLLRSKLQVKAKSKFVVGENQPTPDEQLTRLEDDIRRLRIEFDIFFNGGAKRPPYDTKGRVETLLKRLGRRSHLNVRPKVSIQLARCTLQRVSEISGVARCRVAKKDATAVSVHRANTNKETSAPKVEPVSFVCADAHRDVEVVKNLFESLVEAKRLCGEPTEDLSFPKFHRLIASKADGLKEKLGCDRVHFSVSVENGHVSFKARAD